jgi:peptide/nickel transport system substrate-binding protein
MVAEESPDGPGGLLAGFSAGSRVAGYRLEEQIGAGGMAVVFRAVDERLGRRVALKILAPALASDEAFRHRFLRESRAAAAVDDPHIIPVHEAGEADRVLFIAMRYVPGRDVRTLLQREGALPPERVAAIISPVASALDAAHAAGLIHRDVKPANMLLDVRPGRPDHVYLSDFGLSKGVLSSVGLTGTGQFLGTPNYTAPEQIQGKPVDGRTDQYALACAAFEMLTGQAPFQRDEITAVIYAHLSAAPPPLSSRRPGLPAAADQVFARALAKEPADRYDRCQDFADALREALGLIPYYTHPAAAPPGPPEAGQPAADHPVTEIHPLAEIHPATEMKGPAREAAGQDGVLAATDTLSRLPGKAGRADTPGSVTVPTEPGPSGPNAGQPATQRGQAFRRRRGVVLAAAAVTVVTAAAVVASFLAQGSTGTHGHQSSASDTNAGAVVRGGTVSWAELPSVQPNFIFPFMGTAYFSLANSEELQYLMYRPLYYFGGQNTSPTADYGLSPASKPVYTDGGKTVVITMKGWKWSNGETVDADDVLFWLHMMEAELSNWLAATPGGIPTDITSMSAPRPDEVILHLSKAYSSLWYTYNELSQVTPMPEAWDVTSLGAKPGSGGCTADTAADNYAKCRAVYNFLTAQAKNTGSYTTSPIWDVVDGPWKLHSFNSAGGASFVPNPKYSGSPKPKIAVFKEVPFTSYSAEYAALKTGLLDVGYIPPGNLPAKSPSSALPASNPLGSAYTLAPNYQWYFSYYVINWRNPAMGPVFKQLYAREALEYVADQNGISQAVYGGYAYPTTGVVPAEPPTNPWLPSAQLANGRQGPYPFSISKAVALLTSHGWKMVGGIMTCENPSACGTGIKEGQQFTFTLDYATGLSTFASEAAAYKSDASKAGIGVNLVGQAFDTIIGDAEPSNSAWQGAMYGGWQYSPDYEPTGEDLLASGAGSNSGSYSDPTMDKLISATETSSSIAAYHAYANYAAQQVPFIYMPVSYSIQAVKSKLHGVDFNTLQTELPEYYYFTK